MARAARPSWASSGPSQKLSWENGPAPGQTAARRQETYACRMQEGESRAWEQAQATFTVWWPNTEGSEAERG